MKKEKNNIHKTLTALIGMVLTVFMVIGIIRRCSGETGGKIVHESMFTFGDTLSVAIEMSPLSYFLSNDTAQGYDYDMLREISLLHDVPMVFHPFVRLGEALHGLEKGTYDLVAASLPATTALKERFRLTEPVYLDKQVLVQRRDSATGEPAVTSQEQLLKDTLWISGDSPFVTRLQNMSNELGDTIHLISEKGYSPEHLAILTALGEIRQAVVNEAVARRIAKDYPVLDISTPISFNQFQTWAVAPRDSVLADSLDSWLRTFKESPAYMRLREKYISH